MRPDALSLRCAGRLIAASLAFVLVGYAGAAGQEWRMFGDGSEADRALARSCMAAGHSCDTVIQDACWAEAEVAGDDLTSVAARICDWRAIAMAL